MKMLPRASFTVRLILRGIPRGSRAWGIDTSYPRQLRVHEQARANPNISPYMRGRTTVVGIKCRECSYLNEDIAFGEGQPMGKSCAAGDCAGDAGEVEIAISVQEATDRIVLNAADLELSGATHRCLSGTKLILDR
jgi:hypothetical protein